ncbi:MAG: hypothetical protein ABI559_01945 [Chloroflexota bacterium]
MSGRRVLIAMAPLLVYGAMVACKSSHTTPSTTPASSGASVTAAATRAAAFTPDPSKPTFDMKFTGGLTAEWKTSDNASGATCILADDGYAALNVYGTISGISYGLGYSQNRFAAGTFTYPYASVDPQNEPPFIQIATPTDSSVDWTAGSTGLGGGTAVVTGAKGSPVTLTVDLDMTPRAGGTVVHLSGSLECATS